MKLRIKENTLRMRLTRSEVQLFDESGSVAGQTQFGPGAALTYRLQTSDASSNVSATYADSTVTVHVPSEMARSWAQSEQVGFSHEQSFAGGQTLSILVEKDFQCMSVRPGEDETDHYPNPLAETH